MRNEENEHRLNQCENYCRIETAKKIRNKPRRQVGRKGEGSHAEYDEEFPSKKQPVAEEAIDAQVKNGFEVLEDEISAH